MKPTAKRASQSRRNQESQGILSLIRVGCCIRCGMELDFSSPMNTEHGLCDECAAPPDDDPRHDERKP
jgi:hypothetical protein